MSPLSQQDNAVFRLSPRLHVVPICHGSSDVARAVRDLWLKHRFDCVALPLPASVEDPVEEGIRQLPVVSVVVLPEADRHERPECSYIPLDPCQPVIAAIRTAMEEGVDRIYIDRDVTVYDPTEYPAPDPYALKSVSLASFSGAALPFLPYPKPHSQRWTRIKWMAFKLHELELDYRFYSVCMFRRRLAVAARRLPKPVAHTRFPNPWKAVRPSILSNPVRCIFCFVNCPF